MAEVTLSLEEYHALLSAGLGDGHVGTKLRRPSLAPKKKRKGTPLKGMDKALEKANAMARKKDGSFKKGWDQSKVMTKAHQIRRRG